MPTDIERIQALIEPEHDVVPHLDRMRDRLKGMHVHYLGSAILDIIELRKAASSLLDENATLRRQRAEAREALHQALGALKALGAEKGWAADAIRRALNGGREG